MISHGSAASHFSARVHRLALDATKGDWYAPRNVTTITVPGADPDRTVQQLRDLGAVHKRLERRETTGAQFDGANALDQRGHRRIGSEVGQCAFAQRATIAPS